MTRFAPVMPVETAQKFIEIGGATNFGTYHLLLAHDVLRNPDAYVKTYCNIAELQNGITIMDNSVIETGMAVTSEDMKRAIQYTNANVVILPDVLLDYQGTFRATAEAFTSWRFLETWRGQLQRMLVPQGEHFDDWVKCLEGFQQEFKDEYQWIGVPKNMRLKLGVSRRDALDVIAAVAPEKKVHLLGFSRNIRDDILSARHSPQVMGIDSAVPVRMGLRDRVNISLSNPRHVERGDWWENPTPWGDNHQSWLQALNNCKRVQNWLNA